MGTSITVRNLLTRDVAGGRHARPEASRCLPFKAARRANQRARARLGYRGPHGEPHLMATSGAPVDANGCVASFRKPLDTCDFHYFAAATRRPFSGAWHQQTLKHRHKSPAARTAATQLPRPCKHAHSSSARLDASSHRNNLKRVDPPRGVSRIKDRFR